MNKLYFVSEWLGVVGCSESAEALLDRIKGHDRDIRLARTETSAVSEHAQDTGHKPHQKQQSTNI